MSTWVFIPGAGGGPHQWGLVEADLRARGHDVVAVDLPNDDDAAGLEAYTAATIEQIGDRTDLIVVAHSLGGLTAPIVCDRVPVELLVLVAAMIPAPGERGGDWWANTGHTELGITMDTPEEIEAIFLHDVAPDIAAEAGIGMRNQSGAPMNDPWPLHAWPDVPTRVLIGTHDRFFPADFQRRVTQERLGITPDEIATGHLPMLAQPHELADQLEAYRSQLAGAAG